MQLHRFAVVALLLLPLSCFSAEAVKTQQKNTSAATFFRGSPLPKWIAPLAQVAPTVRRDPVVVRLAETQAWSGANPAVLVNRAVQINDKAHLGEIGQYGVAYYPAYQKLHLHRVAILRGDAVMERTQSVNTRLLEREPNLEGGFYIGATTVQLLLDDIRVGDTLLITYTTEGTNPVFGQVWADDFSWDHVWPVELRRLTVSYPLNHPLRWRELGDTRAHAIQPVIERGATIERARFEGRGLEPVEFEPSTPSTFLPLTMIQTSQYASWKEVATWASALFSRKPDSAAVVTLARQFASGKTQEERASAALHWVQEEIRYFSVSLGQNSHRPQAPDVVLKRRYGDCKDKSNLLIALLGQLGIKAEPVLVSANAPTFPLRLLPSPSWFDHVIVRVEADGKTYFIDPTREGEKGLLSRLPVALPGAAGLLANASTDALLTLPEEPSRLPMVERSEKFVISAIDGDAVLEVQSRYRGAGARAERMRFGAMSAAARRNDVLGDYEKQFKGAVLVGEPSAADGDEGASFAVSARLSLPKPVALEDGWHAITHKILIMDGSLGIPDKLASRKTPFAFPMPLYKARYRLHIVWPQRVKLVNADDAKTVDNTFFTAHREYSWRGNETEFLVDYTIKPKQIAAAQLPELEEASKLLLPFTESSLRVSADTLVTPGAKDFSVQDAQMLAAIARATGVVKELQADPKAKNAAGAAGVLCETIVTLSSAKAAYASAASVIGYLIKEIESIKGQEAAVAGCRGRLEFNEANFRQAVAQWEKSGAPKDSDDLLPDLAWARLLTGDSAGAARDATRFVTVRLADGSLTASDAAFASLTFQRLGKPLMPALQAYIDATVDGPWPRPILGFLTGKLSQEQLLAAARQYGPDKREVALNEAWFYIGERLRQAGKTEPARDALRWYFVNGIRGSRGDVLGRYELAQIETLDPDLRAGLALTTSASPDYKAAKAYFLKAAARGVAQAERALGALAAEGNGGARSDAEALDWYAKAAAHGDLEAMNNLGIIYDAGRGVPVDHEKARDYFSRAAAVGHYHASRNLGRRYLYGQKGLARDQKEGMRHLIAAAKLGNPDAQQLISELYFEGVGTEKDTVQSLYWATRSAEQGNVDGMAQLAFMFAYGHGVPQNLPRALDVWRKAAEGGSANAQVQLGNAYYTGRGVEKNLAMALKFFEQSAAQGNDYAAERAGKAYLYGKGTTRDPKKARLLFDAMLARKEWRSYIYLGAMAEMGLDRPADKQEARRLFALGAELGVAQCQYDLALYLVQGIGGPVNLAEAAAWYRKAADQNHSDAINNLADMYEKGTGVAQDLPQAVRLYRKAAADGNGTALFSLAELNEKGKGMPVNAYLAYVYYQVAHDAGEARLAAPARERVAHALTPEQLKRALAEAGAWTSGKPLPGETGVAAASK